MLKGEASAEAGFKLGGCVLRISARNREAEPAGPPLLTVHTEVHNTLGHAVGIGGHAAVSTLVAGPRAHDGDDGAVGADVDVVCGVGIGQGRVSEVFLMLLCCQ